MRTLPITLVLATMAALPEPAEAQLTAGPTVAWHEDFDMGLGVTVGGDADFVTEGAGWLGDFLWFFPSADGLTYFEINAHATFDFATGSTTVFPYLLAGPQLVRLSVDGGGADTKLGMSVGLGLDLDLGSVRPSVGGRLEVGGGEGFVLFGSLPFQGGGG